MNAPSAARVHSTAIVEEGARLGAGCIVHAYAHISRHCQLDEGVVVHPFAAIGGDPQDLSFDASTHSSVHVGARTVLREHVTINRATKAGGYTEIGADCFLMTGCHVAHDCKVGDRVVIANAVLLAGHVQVGERAFLGGGTVIHQFSRIGEGAMIGGGARISRDVPPFCLVTERNALVGLNVVGLRRRGIARRAMTELKRVYRALDRPVGNLREIAASLLKDGAIDSPEARQYVEFFLSGKRHCVRSRRARSAEPETDHFD